MLFYVDVEKNGRNILLYLHFAFYTFSPLIPPPPPPWPDLQCVMGQGCLRPRMQGFYTYFFILEMQKSKGFFRARIGRAI
jgi:hypothetical protein